MTVEISSVFLQQKFLEMCQLGGTRINSSALAFMCDGLLCQGNCHPPEPESEVNLQPAAEHPKSCNIKISTRFNCMRACKLRIFSKNTFFRFFCFLTCGGPADRQIPGPHRQIPGPDRHIPVSKNTKAEMKSNKTQKSNNRPNNLNAPGKKRREP